MNDAYHAGAIDGARLKEETEKLGKALPTDRLRDYATSGSVATKSQEGFKLALNKTTLAAGATKTAMIALNAAKNALIGMGIGLAINGLISLYQKLANSQKEAIDKANEVVDAYSKQSETVISNIDTIKKLEDEFDTLSKGVDDYGNNISLTTDEHERYQEIVSKILGISPSLTEGWNNEGKAIANKNGLIEQSIALLEEERRLRLDEVTSDDALKTVFLGKKAQFAQEKIKTNFAYDRNELANKLASVGESFKFDKSYDIAKILGLDSQWSQNIAGTINPLQTLVIKNIDEVIKSIKEKRTELLTILNADQMAEVDKIIESYSRAQSVYDQKLEQSSKALNPTLQLVPQTLTAYQEMSDAQKSFVSDYVNGFRITSQTTEKDVVAMKSAILDFTQAIADNPIAQNGIDELFSLNAKKSTMPYGEWQEAANGIINSIADALGLEGEDRKDFIIKIGFKTDSLDKTITEIDEALPRVSADELKTLTEDEITIAYKIKDNGDMTFDELKTEIANIQTVNQTPDLSIPNFEELNKQIDDLQSAYSTLTASVQEYNTNGGQLSIDTLQSLLSLEPQYLACLQNENGQLVINQQSIYNLADALRANAIQKLQAAAAADLLALAEGRTEQLSWAAQVAIANMGSSIADSGNKATLAEQQLYGFANGVATAITAAGGKLDLGNLTDQQDAILNLYKDSASTVFNIGSNMNLVTDATQRAAGAANDLKQQLSQAQSAINSLLTMTMNMIKQQYADEKERLQGLIDDKQDEYEAEKDHLDEINKEKEAQYKRDREAIENQQNALKAELDSRLEMLRLKKEEYYWDKDTKENNKTISELESEYAIAKNDDSLEGIARQKDLEEQLAKAKEEWKDKQFDHDLEQQEDALQKEFDLADEKYQNELDDLERVEEQRKADHQAELDRIEDEYEADREYYERKIEKIEETTSKEGLIRAEAIKLIESKNKDFYNRLMQWNLTYGDGLSSTLEIAWANGYAALETYNNGQLNVLDTLNELALKMNEFESATNRAAAAVSNLNSSRSKLQSELNSLLKYNDKANGRYDDRISEIQDQLRDLDHYDKGGVDTTGGLKRMHGTAQSPEVIFNAIDANKLYNFIHNAPDIGSIIARQMSERINAMNPFNQMNMAAPPAFMGDITVHQGDVIVQGGMDKAALSGIKQALKDNSKLLKDLVCDEIMKKQYLRGHGNMTY